LDLHSGEVLRLYEELSSLYKLRRDSGIPRGISHYVKANATVSALARLSDNELDSVISATDSAGADAVARLIRWATKRDNFQLLLNRLEEIESTSLHDLNSALGLAQLKQSLKSWITQRENDDEAHWQSLLSSQAFVLEHIFSVPVWRQLLWPVGDNYNGRSVS